MTIHYPIGFTAWRYRPEGRGARRPAMRARTGSCDGLAVGPEARLLGSRQRSDEAVIGGEEAILGGGIDPVEQFGIERGVSFALRGFARHLRVHAVDPADHAARGAGGAIDADHRRHAGALRTA